MSRIWMSHVTRIYEIWMSHVTHMAALWCSPVCAGSHGTRMDESYHAYEWVMSREYMRYEWVTSHIWQRYDAHQCVLIVMAHMWMSHVTHMNESCYAYIWDSYMRLVILVYEWVMSHVSLYESIWVTNYMSHELYESRIIFVYEWVMSHISLC